MFVRSIFLTTDTINHCYRIFHSIFRIFDFTLFTEIFNTLFTETNSSCLLSELINKPLEIKTLIVFNFVFCYESYIILCFFLFFLMIDSYFLIFAVNAQSFNPTVELAIPTGMPTSRNRNTSTDSRN